MNHLNQVLLAVQSVCQPKLEKIHLKTRQIQRDKQQYNKFSEQEQRLVINEHQRRYLVDLDQYLDTGLFLDHRWLRNQVQQSSRNLRVLNLFCYTGAISVAAAMGQATEVVSVDTSKTYLKWAEENFALNGLRHPKHRFVRQDVLSFLKTYRGPAFDLIIADPPTFSNSHSRDADWVVQSDHPALLEGCFKHLSPGGKVYFSNNFKKFLLDPDIKEKYDVRNITEESLDPDFAGSKIHHCFVLKHR